MIVITKQVVKSQTACLCCLVIVVLTLSQANVVFPMVAAGLNLGVIMMTSIVGGVAATELTYYVVARSAGNEY